MVSVIAVDGGDAVTFACVRSSATTVPVPAMSCAHMVALPPGAAHMSSTRDPGAGSNAAAATMLGSA